MKIILKSNIIIVLIAVLLCCNKDKSFYAPVTGKVLDSNTMEPINGARVVYNATIIEKTDTHGEFFLNYNLEEFLADSISIYISKPGYWDNEYSALVGNTQKDVFLIELIKK